jgi:hypothetical protein
MEKIKFVLTPHMKALLINYCIINYEENAIIDDEHLEMEYHYLHRNKELHLLFDAEQLNHYLNDGDQYCG